MSENQDPQAGVLALDAPPFADSDFAVGEPLHPELEDWMDELGGEPYIRHPLVYGPMWFPCDAAVLNRQLHSKRDQLKKAEAENDWYTYIWLHERPYRFEALSRIRLKIDDQTYWYLLGQVYTDAEIVHDPAGADVGYMLQVDRPGKEKLMSDAERNFLKLLPEEFVVYRGYSHRNARRGLSWTLDYRVAHWFAWRSSSSVFPKRNQELVARAVVCREDIHAVFLDREEWEIVVDPACLQAVEVVKLPKRPAWLKEIWRICIEGYLKKDHGLSYHGPVHWAKVEANALAIAKAMPGCDLDVVRAFAPIHDAMRVNEGEDPEHGRRAAGLATDLFKSGKLPFTGDQLDQLIYACSMHSEGETTTDPTVGACWDADRMDLTRVNMMPEKKYFSTSAAKDLMFRV